MNDVDTYTLPAPPRTVEQLIAHYAAIGGWGRMPSRGRPPTRFEPARPSGGCRVPVYATQPGRAGYERWGTVREAAAALGVHVNTLKAYLDHPKAKLRGLRLSRYEPPPRPPTEAEQRAEEDRLAAMFVRVPPGGQVGAVVLSAREAVAKRKEQAA